MKEYLKSIISCLSKKFSNGDLRAKVSNFQIFNIELTANLLRLGCFQICVLYTIHKIAIQVYYTSWNAGLM